MPVITPTAAKQCAKLAQLPRRLKTNEKLKNVQGEITVDKAKLAKALMLATLALSGCAAYQVQQGENSFTPRGDYSDNIPAIDVKMAVRKAHRLFTYKHDMDEEWTSYGPELALGVPFRGDCEDFAISVADYLTLQGYDRRHMALALANVGWLPKKGSYNHAVLIVSTEHGQLVVDNQKKRAVSVNFYDPVVFHSLRRMDSEQWKKAKIVKK